MLSSLAVKYRPSAGVASKKLQKLALTTPTGISCASSPTPIANWFPAITAVASSVFVNRAKSRYRAYSVNPSVTSRPSLTLVR